MTDHIVEANKKVIDLDALEKWANEWPHWKWTDAQNDALKALIAELREARRLLTRIDRVYADLQDGNGNHPTELRKVRAFLSRNGKGEGG